jgi:hypothetical protein
MLNNYAVALQALDRSAEFDVVIAAALQLPPDHTRSKFVAWAAQSAALGGRHAEAAQWLAKFDNTQDNQFAALAIAHARAIVDVAEAPPESRRAKFAEVRRTMAEVRESHAVVAAIGYVARDHRRVLLAAARLAGSWWRWWYTVPLPAFSITGKITLGTGLMLGLALIFAVLVTAAGGPAVAGVFLYFFVRALAEADTKNR